MEPSGYQDGMFLFNLSYVDGYLGGGELSPAHPRSPLKCVNRIHSLEQDSRSNPYNLKISHAVYALLT
jgi:hypothetical protein